MAPAEPCLCLDGSVRGQLRVGVLSGGAWLAESSASSDPAESIQPCVEQALRAAGLRLADLAAFAVNLGPGSVLGIRATVLSARAWGEVAARPVLTWSGHLAAAWLARGTCDAVVSEGRSGHLNVQRVGPGGPVGELAESAPADVAALRLRPLRGGFRHETALALGEPLDVWPRLPALLAAHDLLEATERPDALNSPASYALWSGRRHQGGDA